MPSVNKVILVGMLGKDPDFKTTPGDKSVAQFPLATDERYKAGDEWVSKTEWHTIVCWGRLAEIARDYLEKGKCAYIEGRIQTRKWQDKEKKDRYSTEIIADKLVLLTPKGRSDAMEYGNDPAYVPGPGPEDYDYDPNETIF